MSTNAERFALHFAVAQGNVARVEALLAGGANPNLRLPRQLLDRAALHICVAAYSAAVHAFHPGEAGALEEICAALLKAGARLDQLDSTGAMPSGVADTMPRSLAAAVRQRAFADVGVFDPARDPDLNIEWLMDPDALRLDPISGSVNPARFACEASAARQVARTRAEKEERRRMQARPWRTPAAPRTAHRKKARTTV